MANSQMHSSLLQTLKMYNTRKFIQKYYILGANHKKNKTFNMQLSIYPPFYRKYQHLVMVK